MKQEKGIALIFTLIMLSLLLILALAFALDSMFDQKAAYNSASSSAADSLAQSQLQEILCLVRHDAANFSKVTWSRDNNITSSYASNIRDYHTDMLSDPATSLLKVTGLLDAENNTSAFAEVNWNYIKDSADNNRIVGRTAFVIIPDEKIPLPSLIDSTYDETANAETRIGVNVSEINVRYAIPNTTAAYPSTINNLIGVLNWNTQGIGEYTGSNWTSFDALFDLITTAPNVFTLTTDDKNEFQTNLTIASSQTEEAFWADTNDNDKLNEDELYRRFNLARTDWDTATHTDDLQFMRKQILMLKEDDTSETPTYEMQAWDSSDGTAATEGLPWLALFGYKTDGTEDDTVKQTFDTVYARRCQIAANLKDYCDDNDNNRPTSDVDPATWVSCASPPKFTGNEKTPYIDKVGIKITVTRENPDTSTAKAVISMDPHVGLVNIYADAFNTNNLKGVIKGTVTIIANGTTSSPISFDSNLDFGGWGSGSGTGYSNFCAGSNSPGVFTIPCAESTSMQVTVSSVTIDKVVIYDSSTSIAYDYAVCSDISGSTSYVFNGLKDDTFDPEWCGSAVVDPRQNLNKGDWIPLTSMVTNDPEKVLSLSGSYTGQSNAENSTYGGGDNTKTPDNLLPTGSDPYTADPEDTLTDPVNLSTAFIRNGPMLSPWELGFIHRGYRWQTINLKTYDATKAYQTIAINSNNYIPGGGLYNDGDANILDQIKMTDEATSMQKINLNSPNEVTFQALLSKIQYGCNINSTMDASSMASGGTEITAPDIATIASAIKTKYEATSNPEERQTRASVVNELKLSTAGKDAVQEELIGKAINLTKIGSQAGHFTIVVVAQSIKDVGGVGVDIPMIKSSIDGSHRNSPAENCRIGFFNAEINNSNPEQSIYFDEITATRKIIFRGQTLGANKIKVIGTEHAN